MLRRGLLCGVAVLLPACGPVNSAIALRDAKDALEMARQAEAPDVAPYEWTLAHAYYDKAREEQGYADFKMSTELAQRTSELAQFAVDAVGGYRPTGMGGTEGGPKESLLEPDDLGPPPGGPPPGSESPLPDDSGSGLGPAPGSENGPPPPGGVVGPSEPEPAAPPPSTGPTEAPLGVTVYTDPATGTQYYIDPNTGQVVYLSGAQ